MRRLDFSLPRWSELVWASPELRDHWAPVFAAAPLALVNRWIDAVAAGDLPIAAVAAKPFQIPLLMRRARTLGCTVKLLGDLHSDGVTRPVVFIVNRVGDLTAARRWAARNHRRRRRRLGGHGFRGSGSRRGVVRQGAGRVRR